MGPGSVALAAALAACAAVAAPPPVSVTLASRAMQPGELVLLTIDGPDAAAHLKIRAFDRDVTPFLTGEHQWRALVGIDLDTKPGRYAVSVEADGQAIVRPLIVAPKAFRTRRLTVDPDFVTPPPSEAKRIEEEARLLERTWAASAPERLWTPFAAPVPQPSNSAFGTRSVFNGTPRNAHGGADFLSPAGTPIAAPSAGRIVIARNLYYSGNTVVIDHGLGVFSTLAHLSAIDVLEGQHVAGRQIVGRVGATGRVTGPHLHWAVRVGGARVDPLAVLSLLGSK